MVRSTLKVARRYGERHQHIETTGKGLAPFHDANENIYYASHPDFILLFRETYRMVMRICYMVIANNVGFLEFRRKEAKYTRRDSIVCDV
jgi:hypothetical protein